MVFADRIAWRWLDFVSGLGLILAVLVFFPTASVASVNPSYDAAMAACEAYDLGAHWPNNYDLTQGCRVSDQVVSGGGYVVKTGCFRLYSPTGSLSCRDGKDNGDAWANWYFSGVVPPPPNTCSDEPDSQAFVDARDIASAETHQICIAGGGQTAPKGCVQKFTNGSSMGIRPPGYENFLFIGSWHSTGGTCTQGADGTWTADDTGAAPPNAQPKPTTAPPKLCGGGSCIDPSSGKACIVDSTGKQFCTPVPVTDPNSHSDCYSDGSSTLCAGSKPPLPNPPPITPVTDPATDITSSDRYGTMSPGGTTSTTIVNNYTSGSTSGQQSGDRGPAPPSSSGGTGTGNQGDGTGGKSFTGGTDCDTPPVCTGDASLCGIARVNWSNLCRLHRDVGSDDPAPSLSSLSPAGSASLWSDASSSASGVAAAAMQGDFDGTGFGYGVACPMKDLALSVAGRSFAIPMSNACVVGPWVRGLLLAFATLWAAMIVVKGD